MQVKEGQLYLCGPHLLACGDLVKGHFFDFYGDKMWEWTYSDPPWGEGLAKMFRTMNGQKGHDPKYPTLLQEWARVASRSIYGAYGEMGIQWQDDLPTAMETFGWTMAGQWKVVYGSGKDKRPSLLQHFVPIDREYLPPNENLEGLSGQELVKTAMKSMNAGCTVVDPCIGLGHTLRAGHAMGIHVLGMELNPKRLARCLEWIEKKGIKPELISEVPV